jgi:hypothetical protein
MPKPPQNKLYSTPEASELTKIPESTIRNWMSCHPGLFIEGTHYLIEESGRKMWTEVGIEFLKTRTQSSETESNETFLDALLDDAASFYAEKFYQELPVRVLRRIQQMRTNPTEAEQQLIQDSTQRALSIGTFELLPTYIKGLPNAENQA